MVSAKKFPPPIQLSAMIKKKQLIKKKSLVTRDRDKINKKATLFVKKEKILFVNTINSATIHYNPLKRKKIAIKLKTFM